MEATKILAIVLVIILIPTAILMFMLLRSRKKVHKYGAKELKNLEGEMLTVGFDRHFPPMSYLNEGRKLRGFDVEFALQAAGPLGAHLKMCAIDWKEKENLLESGEIDCVWSGLSITEARKERMLFSDPYLSNRIVLIGIREEECVSSIEELADRRVAVQEGSSALEKLLAIGGPDVCRDVYLFDTNEDALEALDNGEADLVCTDETFVFYTKRKKVVADRNEKDWPKYFVSPLALGEEKYAIGFRKGNDELCRRMNEVIAGLWEKDELGAISDRWFDMDLITGADERPVDAAKSEDEGPAKEAKPEDEGPAEDEGSEAAGAAEVPAEEGTESPEEEK